MSNLPEAIRAKLASIPWDELRHAYGIAADAPRWIEDLASADSEQRLEAINEFLYSSVYHQSSLYSATPFAIAMVLQLLRDPEIAGRSNRWGSSMKADLLHFIRICCDSGDKIDLHPTGRTVAEEALEGEACYPGYVSDPDPKVAKDAKWLVQFCEERRKYLNALGRR